MIELRLSGRAGNQFFQYGMIRAYMKKNNIDEPLYISMEHIEKFRKKNDDSFQDYLKYFNVVEYISIPKAKSNFIQKIIELVYKLNFKIKDTLLKLQKKKWTVEDWKNERKKWKKFLNKKGIYYYFKGDFEFEKTKYDKKIFFGSFESAKFFDDIKDELIQELTPKKERLNSNLQLYNIIENTNSVCVSIRRGDFLNSNNINSFYVCTPEYFHKAIEKIKEIVEKPQFVVFSDDVQWCKENMNFPENTVYESGNDPVWEKLRLMYSCKNFIISNSTFSWWAQYLSRNQNKVVIAPEIWSKHNYCQDIYQENWIKIKI